MTDTAALETVRPFGTHDLADLPESGDYVRDCAAGRAAAVATIERLSVAPCGLAHIVQASIQRGRFGAIEIGFFHELAERATC